MNGKFDCAIVDPLTGPMARNYYADRKKPNFDQYRDYAIEPMSFIEWCNSQSFNTVILLGHPGVGKTTLIETLIGHYKPMIFHMDTKDLPTLKLCAEFGTHKKPGKSLKYLSSLKEVQQSLKIAKSKDLLDPFFTVFITGHIDRTIKLDDPREKLKIVGAMLNRAEPESWVNNVGILRNPEGEDRYIEWEKDDSSPARRIKGLFEGTNRTPADLKLVMDEYQEKLRPLYV